MDCRAATCAELIFLTCWHEISFELIKIKHCGPYTLLPRFSTTGLGIFTLTVLQLNSPRSIFKIQGNLP